MSVPNWMTGVSWHMTMMNGTNLPNSFSNGVSFDTSNNPNIVVQYQGQPWGIVDVTLVSPNAISVTGVTSQTTSPSNQSFRIDYADRILQCYMDEATNRSKLVQRGLISVVFGVIVGTLLAGAIGFAAGSIFLGAVTGLIATTAGSLVTAARVISDLPDFQGGGPTPTWVANDTGVGKVGKPGPHPIVRRPADAAQA